VCKLMQQCCGCQAFIWHSTKTINLIYRFGSWYGTCQTEKFPFFPTFILAASSCNILTELAELLHPICLANFPRKIFFFPGAWLYVAGIKIL
jgi:hypothetical protein